MDPLRTDATALRTAELPKSREVVFGLEPTQEERDALAGEFGLIELRKLKFAGKLTPVGKADWCLTAKLGATVIQPCVVTLAPVTTRIDEPIERSFLTEPPDMDPGGDAEIPEDDTADSLGEVIALDKVMAEALALALPQYPRATDVELSDAQFAAPGIAPMTDDDARAFAGLKDLRDSLKDVSGED
jgi:uncharacterized metal-binding protein YceD (DUF177 family)